MPKRTTTSTTTPTGCPCCHKPVRLSGRDESSGPSTTSYYVCDNVDCPVLSVALTTVNA